MADFYLTHTESVVYSEGYISGTCQKSSPSLFSPYQCNTVKLHDSNYILLLEFLWGALQNKW
jgi:hypothetical protein